MNPNISEAARRAADRAATNLCNFMMLPHSNPLFKQAEVEVLCAIQSALDSVHPAPLNASSSNGPMGPPSGDGKGEAKVWNAGLNLYAPDHPAPKEGETPICDAAKRKVW